MVTGLQIGDVAADLLDDACRLVTQHCRNREGVLAFHEVQVAVAQACHGSADQHFARTGILNLDILDRQGLVRGMEYGGFHRVSSLGVCLCRLFGNSVMALSEGSQCCPSGSFTIRPSSSADIAIWQDSRELSSVPAAKLSMLCSISVREPVRASQAGST